MNNDNGRQYYGVGLDLTALRQDAEKSKEILAEIGTSAVRQGSIIDQAFGSQGAAHGFNTLEAAIRAAGSQIKEMDFGTAEEKIGALSFIIRENEKVLANETELLNKWKQDAQDAFNSGDTGTLEAVTADIDAQIAKIQELSQETEGYRNTLQAVMEVSGMGAQTVEVPRLYDSEEDIKHVENLRQQIAATQAEIARLGAEGGDTSKLTAELSQMKDELNDCERSAAETAAALGSDLGGRASEAQQNLYQLNTAITAQQEVIARLSQALEEARTTYETLQQTEGANSDEVERAAAVYDSLSESLTNAQEQLAGLQGAQVTAQAQWQQVSNEVQTHDSIMVKMLGGYENYQNIIGKLPQPIQSVIGGIQGMTGAAKAFIATPLGAILAAIILALQTVYTWLNSTVEGQLKFAEISGYVSGVLGQLKEIVITVGKALFKAFSDPKTAIKELWEAIKTNIVNRFKAVGEVAAALGKVIKAAFTLDADGIKAGLKELTDGFLKFGTGVDKLTDKMANYAKGVHAAASENANIARENRELEIQVSEWQKRNQQLEQQKALARGKMYNTSLSTAERRKAKQDFEAALKEQSDMEMKFANKRIELQKRSMALTSNTIEDENKLRDLEADREAITTRRLQQEAQLQRREGTLNNTDAAAQRKAEQQAQREERERQRREQALVSIGEMEAQLILSNQDKQLSLMKEGHNKRMAEITLERDRELQELEKMKNKFAKLNRQAGTKTGEDGLTDVQRSQLAEGRTNVERQYQKGVQDLLESELQDILTYEQKRLKIQEQYADRRKALYETDAEGNATGQLKAGVTQGNVDELDRAEREALSAVDEQFAQREESYQAWCNEIASYSLEQLRFVLQQAEDELKKLEKSGASDTKLAQARAKVQTAQKAVQKEQAKTNVSPDKRSIKEWQDLYKTLNECTRSFKDIGDAVGGTVGEVISAAGEIATSTLSMINGIVQLVQMSSTAMTATASTASKAIQTVEKASVILAVISAALQVATAIANLFNNDEAKQKEIEKLQGRIDQLQWELDHAEIIRLQENSGKAIDRVRQTLSETYNELLRNKIALNDWTGVWTLLFGKVRNNTELLTKTANKLATAYGNIAYTADKALGGKKYDNAREQLKNIAEQQILIQEQIRQEEDKKKTDHNKIQDWEQQIEELGQQAIEIINEMVEDIIGGSSSDIAEQLSDAFFEAFQNGENYAEAWGEKVNEIVADVLKRMLVQKYLEEPLGEIFDKYKAKWFKDGQFVGLQAVIDSMSGFAADLNAVGEYFRDIWESLPDSVKNMFTVTDATREASQKGIATASQESVDELNGRATAIQGHTYSISENTKLLLASVNLILQSVLNIERHTETMAEQVSDMRLSVKEVKDTVNDIALKGIKLK